MNPVFSSVLGLLLALSLLPAAQPAEAQTLEMIVDLGGNWRFEVGDEPLWASEEFDDSRWDRVQFPGTWEDQGFPGYDGFGWARKTFKAPARPAEDAIVLQLGKVDDVDEVYLNGVLVGYAGELPPHYSTAYGTQRQYAIDPGLVRWGGANVIAVRIYDSEQVGGIVAGPLGIYVDRSALLVQQPLAMQTGKQAGGKGPEAPVWRFKAGDRPEWAEPDFDDSDWKRVTVPLPWDSYGYKEYDGYGWYRVRFRTPPIDPSKSIILILGKIDDSNEAYLNGVLVGKTGKFPPKWRINDAYKELRAYTIPADRFVAGGENVLAVRVYDGWLHGGIYSGPIGFVTRETYVAWARDKRPRTTVLHQILDFFSGDDSRFEPAPPAP